MARNTTPGSPSRPQVIVTLRLPGKNSVGEPNLSASGSDFEPEEGGPKRKQTRTPATYGRQSTKLSKRQRKTEAKFTKPIEDTVRSTTKRAFDINATLEQRGLSLDDCGMYVKRLHTAITKHGLQDDPGLPQVLYTEATPTAMKILDSPLYNPEERLFILLEDQVSLVDHVQPDLQKVKRWRLLVQNTKDPSSNPVEVFLLPLYGWRRRPCSVCEEKPRVRKGQGWSRPLCTWPDFPNLSACLYCIRLGKAEECKKERANLLHRWAVLLDSVCGSRDRILHLGKIVVELMNRFPSPLNLEAWESCVRDIFHNTHQIVCDEQRTISLAALVEWKKSCWPDFDLGTLPHLDKSSSVMKGISGDLWSSQWYGQVMNTHIHRGRDRTIFSYWHWSVWPIDPVRPFEGRMPKVLIQTDEGVRITPKNVDTAAIDAIESLPYGYHIFGADSLETQPEVPSALTLVEASRAVKLLRLAAFAISGMTGTKDALFTAHNNVLAPFQTDTLRRESVGPYLGGVVLAVGHDTSLAFNPTFSESLVNRDGVPFKDLVTGPGKAGTSTLHVAYVLQQVHNSIARGSSVVETVFHAIMAVDDMSHGRVTTRAILESYCNCNHRDSQNLSHYCMVCLQYRSCKNLVKDATGVIHCVHCAGKVAAMTVDLDAYIPNRLNEGPITTGESYYSFKQKTRRGATRIHRRESPIHRPPFDPRTLFQSLHKAHAVQGDPMSYICEYTGRMAPSIEGGLDPESPSIERPHTRVVLPDLRIGLHYPKLNAVCCMDALNRMKGSWPPAFLPLIKRAAQLHQDPRSKIICCGYHPELRDEWEKLKRAALHLRAISMLTPSTNQRRIAEGQDITAIRQITSMGITGVWDGISYYPHCEILPSKVNLSKKFPYSDENWPWAVLLQNIAEMQADHEVFNPHRLEVPYVGKHNVPWFWDLDFANEDSDYDAYWFFRLFSSRYRMMDEVCDWQHDHPDDSPATLFMEYVVQFFETGGKCHITGWIMCPLDANLSTFSCARGVTQLQEDGSVRYIQAGDFMRTGCQRLIPTNMRRDYDRKTRTIIFESWLANVLRFDYFNDERLIDRLVKILLDIKTTCDPWYTGLKPSLNDYMAIPLPTNKSIPDYNRKFRAFVNGNRREAGLDEVADISTIAVDDNDEEEFHAERRAKAEEAINPAQRRLRVYEELLAIARTYDSIDNEEYQTLVQEAAPLLKTLSPKEGELCESLLKQMQNYVDRLAGEDLTLDDETNGSEHEIAEARDNILARCDGFVMAANELGCSDVGEIQTRLEDLRRLASEADTLDIERCNLLISQLETDLQDYSERRFSQPIRDAEKTSTIVGHAATSQVRAQPEPINKATPVTRPSRPAGSMLFATSAPGMIKKGHRIETVILPGWPDRRPEVLQPVSTDLTTEKDQTMPDTSTTQDFDSRPTQDIEQSETTLQAAIPKPLQSLFLHPNKTTKYNMLLTIRFQKMQKELAKLSEDELDAALLSEMNDEETRKDVGAS